MGYSANQIEKKAKEDEKANRELIKALKKSLYGILMKTEIVFSKRCHVLFFKRLINAEVMSVDPGYVSNIRIPTGKNFNSYSALL